MVQALPREAAEEPGPVTSLQNKLATWAWGGGTVFRGFRPGERQAHIFSPNPPDGLRGLP